MQSLTNILFFILLSVSCNAQGYFRSVSSNAVNKRVEVSATPPTVQSAVAIDNNVIRVVFDKNVTGVTTTGFNFDGSTAGNDKNAASVTGIHNVYDFSFSTANWSTTETIDMDYSGGTVNHQGAPLATVTNQTVVNKVADLAFANDGPTVTTIWSTTDWLNSNMGFGDNSTHHSFFVVEDTVYIVWVEADDRRPMVKKVWNNGASSSSDYYLDAADYSVKDDSHNRFSIGVSSDGYIHISGDMHNYRSGGTTPTASDSTTWSWMPSRYHNEIVMYWVSDNPWDVSSFTWEGDGDNNLNPDGFAFTYQKFEQHPDGTLFFEARQRVYDGGHGDGEVGAGMWRYETSDRSWTKLGAIPSSGSAETATEYVIVHVDGSRDKGSSTEFYQGMESDITIDAWGRIHAAYSVALGTDQATNNRLLYGYSDDHGDTWYKANGTQITMPMTPSTADVIISGAVGDMPSVAAMPNGYPIVSYNDLSGGGSGNREYAYWTGSSWNTGNDAPTNGTTKDFIHVGPDGMFTWSRHNSDDIRRVKEFSQTSWLRNQDDAQCCFSDQGMIQSGNMYALSTSGTTLKLIKIVWGIGTPTIY